MRITCLNMVYELARNDSRIIFIGSDLGKGTLQKFKEEMPDRFFMEGISEGHIIGMAAGMALEGKIPYVNTIATFLTRRCLDQIVIDLCLHNVNVRLIGNGGGLVYAPLGPTHEAIEDIAIMRAIPNMTIVAPADAEEMKRFMPISVDYPGPIYIRLAKGFDPIVTKEGVPFEIGKGIVVQTGEDALIITTGITLRLALESAAALGKSGVRAAILHMPTIKPLDCEAVLDLAASVRAVVTVEELVFRAAKAERFAQHSAPAATFHRQDWQPAIITTTGTTPSARVVEFYDATSDPDQGTATERFRQTGDCGGMSYPGVMLQIDHS